MYTLGINAAYHDSAACLVRDGDVIAAAEEERFTRRKHAKRSVPFSTWELPFHAIAYCMEHENITLGDIEHIAYSYSSFAATKLTLPRRRVWLCPAARSMSRGESFCSHEQAVAGRLHRAA